MQDRSAFVPKVRVALGLALFPLLFFLYFRAFKGHVIGSWETLDDWKVPAAMATFVSLFTSFAVLAAIAVFEGLRDRRRLAPGGAAFVDGQFAAAEGEVRAQGKLLKAPFTGRPCVAYEYDVWLGSGGVPGRMGRGSGRGWAGVAGVALAPCVIEAAQGSVRLLGWTPLQTHFRPEWLEDTPKTRSVLKRVLAERRFEKMTGIKGLKVLGQLVNLQKDDDGSLHHDWLFDEKVLDDPASVLVSERIVEEREHVGASGLWSEEGQGLYGQVGNVGLDLWPGHLGDQRRRLLVQPAGRLAFMLLATAALHGMVALVWKSEEEVAAVRAEQAAERAAGRFQAVLWKDLESTRAAIRAGVPVDQRDHYGQTVLMWAAGQHEPEWVRMLLEEGADVHAAHPSWGTALDQAVRSGRPGRDEVIALLKAAGARDFRVTAVNGRAVPPGGGPFRAVLLRWYDAIEKGDLPGLNAQFVTADLDSIDFDLWRRVRPLNVDSIEGYANEEAATLGVRGRDPEGRARSWGYHLVRRPAESPDWRILYEWERN
jgi:hypothetical protein